MALKPTFSPSPFPRPKPTDLNRRPFQRNNESRDEHRVNERIRVPEVRLVDEKGNQVGIVQTFKALQMAREKGLDLMEVAPNVSPPVCKICDYGKFKYEKKKKENEAKKKQIIIKIKEIQLRPTTEEHDLDYKMKNARGFLEDGDKVKFSMIFRGRQMAHTEACRATFEEIIKALADVSVVESPIKMEGRKMFLLLASTAKKQPKGTKFKAEAAKGHEKGSEKGAEKNKDSKPATPKTTTKP